MGNTPPPTYTYQNTSKNKTIVTEHLLNTSRRPSTPEKIRKKSIQSGRTKGGGGWGEMRKQMGPTYLRGSWKEEDRFLAHSLSGRWARTEKETYRLKGECHKGLMAGRRQERLVHHPVHPSLRFRSASVGTGWVLDLGVWRTDPGKGPVLAVQKQPEGTRVW